MLVNLRVTGHLKHVANVSRPPLKDVVENSQVNSRQIAADTNKCKRSVLRVQKEKYNTYNILNVREIN